MTETRTIDSIVSEFGYSVKVIDRSQVELFLDDLDPADMYDLNRTWRSDWRKELEATFSLTERGFVMSSELHGGALAFGITAGSTDTAQIWLLQSASFREQARAAHGNAWTLRLKIMTNSIIEVFLENYPTLFNFVARQQIQNVRWLKQNGFKFYRRPNDTSEMMLFAIGEKRDSLALDPEFWTKYIGPASGKKS